MKLRATAWVASAVVATALTAWFFAAYRDASGGEVGAQGAAVSGVDSQRPDRSAESGRNTASARDAAVGVAPAVPPVASPNPAIVPASKPIQPSPLTRRVYGNVLELSSLYRELTNKQTALSADEVLALKEVLSICTTFALVAEGDARADSAISAKVAAKGRSNAPRVAAADKLRRACNEIPEADLSDARRSALGTELNRLGHPANDADRLRALAELGFATQSHDQAVALLSNAEPAVMLRLADWLTYEIRLTGMSPEFRARGLDVEQLSRGWELAICEMTRGCGVDSNAVLDSCIATGICDANSFADFLRKYDPEKFLVADRFRELILASYRTGDWTWLNLPTLRSKLPA